MSLSRAVNWVCLSCVLLVAAASCTSQKDTEADVPSGRGAVQPAASGPLLAEGVACTKLKSAESSARAQLSCPPVTRACPDYIRPAGGADCFQYSQGSLDGCADLYASFTTCADFDAHPCLVSAADKCDAVPAPNSEGGAGGTGGAPSDEAGGAPSDEAGGPGVAGDGSVSAGAGGA
ncbi:MAG: hypothetical protein ABIQ16_24615 [Polyangiaceae bacterium]